MKNLKKLQIEAIEKLVERHNKRKPIILDVSQMKDDARRIKRDAKNIISRYKIK